MISHFVNVGEEFAPQADQFEQNANDKKTGYSDADEMHYFGGEMECSGVDHIFFNVWRVEHCGIESRALGQEIRVTTY